MSPVDATRPNMIKSALIPLQQPDVVLMLEAGYVLIEMNKRREAEEIFIGVAAMLPHSEVPQMALGHLYFAQGRFAQALKSHERARELNKQSAAVHAALAETLFFLKRPSDAQVAIDEALRLEPEGPAAIFARSLSDANRLGVFERVK